eukprot:GHVT01079416.1.p1 GENE.GHVT01079416.1~~GHVT01079416.1.p1  ORF type:complete len:211 (+),score=15.34 GHVT01079416.1:209-841(+)
MAQLPTIMGSPSLLGVCGARVRTAVHMSGLTLSPSCPSPRRLARSPAALCSLYSYPGVTAQASLPKFASSDRPVCQTAFGSRTLENRHCYPGESIDTQQLFLPTPSTRPASSACCSLPIAAHAWLIPAAPWTSALLPSPCIGNVPPGTIPFGLTHFVSTLMSPCYCPSPSLEELVPTTLELRPKKYKSYKRRKVGIPSYSCRRRWAAKNA